MIIEITGPSGSGKSTLIKYLISNSKNIERELLFITDSKSKISPNYFEHTDKQNLKTDIKCLVPTLRLFIKKPGLFFYIFGIFLNIKSDKFSIARSIWRKIGIYNYYRLSKFRNKIIIIDEGPLHSLHNIFVSVEGTLNKKEIKKYINLIPKADLTVILKAPLKDLILRLRKRGDLSPRIKSEKDLKVFIKAALDVYSSFPIVSESKNCIIFDTSKIKYELISGYIIEAVKNNLIKNSNK